MSRGTRRLTTAQALVAYLANQHVERDGLEQPLFAGVLGIFGHGNVAGIGEALQQPGAPRYVLARNEQAMVHTAVAYAKARNRLSTWACTTSIGPGATNMVTGAALATVNRLPVLLLPGDVFASRRVAPLLQQLEWAQSQDVSVNDAFRPVTRYWDRINRPEQLVAALPAAVRVLTDQAETGAVCLALPQDVQAEAFDFPQELLARRVWRIPRPLPDEGELRRAVALIRGARRPLVVAGGGVIYSEASQALAALSAETGMPVGETQAGKGALPFDHPQALGAIGVTGTSAANAIAREADVVIGVGTRWADFPTASNTAFQHPEVRFVNVNVAALDAWKHTGIPLQGDARATLERLREALAGHRVSEAYAAEIGRLTREWRSEVDRLVGERHAPLPAQAEVIGAVNEAAGDRGVVVCAAGSLPGDLHKLWRTRDPKGYHMEYGYSCMGYELAGGLGVKLADPGRDVFVMVGDGSWLMMASELQTALQEGADLTVVLVENHGFASIGGLSRSLGSGGFGTSYRFRGGDGQLSGAYLPLDLVANAASLGAHAVRAPDVDALRDELARLRGRGGVNVIVIETDPGIGVPDYGSWWDVPVAEISSIPSVREARSAYERGQARERAFLVPEG